MVIQVLISSKSQTCALLVWQILLGSMESDGFRTLYLTVYYSLLSLESTS